MRECTSTPNCFLCWMVGY
jgi:hypothetical protein